MRMLEFDMVKPSLKNEVKFKIYLDRESGELKLVQGEKISTSIFEDENGAFYINHQGRRDRVHFLHQDEKIFLHLGGEHFVFEYLPSYRHLVEESNEDGSLLSKMPGKVLQVLVKKGEEIEKGQAVLLLESMKMENSILSPFDGKVLEVLVRDQDLVSADQLLIQLEKRDEE